MANPTTPAKPTSTAKKSRVAKTPAVWVGLPQEVIDWYGEQGANSEYGATAQQVIRATVMKRYNDGKAAAAPATQGGVPVAE